MLSLWLVAALSMLAPEGEKTLLIEGFETDADLGRWTLAAATVERTADGAALLSTKAIPEGEQGWPAIKRTSSDANPFPAIDWTPYDTFAFDVTCLDETPLPLRLQLDDAAGGRWTTGIEIPSRKPTVFEVPVSGIDGGVDLTRMRHIDIFLSSPRAPHRFLIDNVRLIARPLRLLHDQAQDDPFGKGRARLRGRLSRAADWSIEIAGQGRVVRRVEGSSQDIAYEWDGADEQGQAVPAGRYPVALNLTDAAFDGQETRQTWLVAEVADGAPPFLIGRPAAARKIFLDDYPRRELKLPLTLDMVKNEVEAQQFVIQAGIDLENVHVAVENLRCDRLGPAPTVQVYQVGYVDCQPPPYPVSRNGWWPDPLLPVDTFSIADHEAQPVWLSWRTTPETVAGVHRGEVVISADGVPPTRLPIAITVHDITLPVETRMKTAFTHEGGSLRKVYGREDPAMELKYWEFITDHRVDPDNIYRGTPPDIELLRHFEERGQLGFQLKYVGSREKPYSDEDKAAIAAVLDPYVEELRKHPELLAKAYIYGYDDPELFEWMRDLFGWLKERYPEIPTMTTAYDHSFGTETGLNDVIDIWVPLTPRYNLELARQVRQEGTHVWWYTCIGPRHPYCNWLIEYEALESRVIWWQAYQNEVEGHLYYRMSRWPLSEHPIDPSLGARTDWPAASYKTANGDGSLFCAGIDGPITTIRFENVRDGLEDTELFAILDELRAGREDAAPSGRAFIDRVTPSLTEYTRDTAELLAVRREVIDAILERLGR